MARSKQKASSAAQLNKKGSRSSRRAKRGKRGASRSASRNRSKQKQQGGSRKQQQQRMKPQYGSINKKAEDRKPVAERRPTPIKFPPAKYPESPPPQETPPPEKEERKFSDESKESKGSGRPKKADSEPGVPKDASVPELKTEQTQVDDEQAGPPVLKAPPAGGKRKGARGKRPPSRQKSSTQTSERKRKGAPTTDELLLQAIQAKLNEIDRTFATVQMKGAPETILSDDAEEPLINAWTLRQGSKTFTAIEVEGASKVKPRPGGKAVKIGETPRSILAEKSGPSVTTAPSVSTFEYQHVHKISEPAGQTVSMYKYSSSSRGSQASLYSGPQRFPPAAKPVGFQPLPAHRRVPSTIVTRPTPLPRTNGPIKCGQSPPGSSCHVRYPLSSRRSITDRYPLAPPPKPLHSCPVTPPPTPLLTSPPPLDYPRETHVNATIYARGSHYTSSPPVSGSNQDFLRMFGIDPNAKTVKVASPGGESYYP